MFAKEKNSAGDWRFYDWNTDVNRFANLVHDFGCGKTFDEIQLSLRVKKLLRKITSGDTKRLKPANNRQVKEADTRVCKKLQENSNYLRKQYTYNELEVLEEVEAEMETESVRSVPRSCTESGELNAADYDDDRMVGMISDFVSRRLQSMAGLVNGDLFEIRELDHEFDSEIDYSLLKSKSMENNLSVDSQITPLDEYIDDLICETINSMIESKYLNYA